MIWVIVGIIAIFVIIGLMRPRNSTHELTDHQLQELERTKSNTFPPGDGGSS